jgi:hypothetical protein
VKKISTYGSIIIGYKKEENEEMVFAAIVTLIIEPKISLLNKFQVKTKIIKFIKIKLVTN